MTSGSTQPTLALRAFDSVDALADALFKKMKATDACRYEFGAAFRGMRARAASVDLALGALAQPDLVGHAQTLVPTAPAAQVLVDTYVAQVLFGIWSTFECMVFGINALGCAVDPTDFHSVETTASLKKVDPNNVFGGGAGRPARPGYAMHFPKWNGVFDANKAVLARLNDCHNISKHRHAAAAGGTVHPGFIEKLKPSIGEGPAMIAAMARATWIEILLESELGVALPERSPSATTGVLLDELVAEYRRVVREAGEALIIDLTALTK